MFLCIQVNAQQRRKAVTQRRTTTSVKNSNLQAIRKTRKVGDDGYIWYELQKGNLFGAADLEGKIIIPIKYTNIDYCIYDSEHTHFFRVKKGDFVGIYTRYGNSIIPIDKHFTYAGVYSCSLYRKTPILYVRCRNNYGQNGLYDIRGNEVIPPTDYQSVIIIKFENNDLAHITYEKDGLDGAYDLNGNLLTKPVATAYITVYKDKIKIVNEIGKDEFDSKYIYGSYSEDTRFDYDNYDGLYSPFKSYKSSSSSSSFSSSSSSSSSTSNRPNTNNRSSKNQPRQVWKERWRICTACDPNRKGYCNNCHGQGGYYIGNIFNVCGVCGGGRSCPMCMGRGEIKETYSTWE